MAIRILVGVFVDVATRLLFTHERFITYALPDVGTVINARVDLCIGDLLGEERGGGANQSNHAHVLGPPKLLRCDFLCDSHYCKFEFIYYKYGEGC